MKLLNRAVVTTFSITLSAFLFTACSSKSVNSNYNEIYKDTGNKNINNSPAMHRATMRPYSVFGITYYPEIVPLGHQHSGIASWYGPTFHSKKTSNGETYNMYAQTAAHKTLPMNTIVRVDNLDNGKSTIVRINDRGPFVSGRVIDLSNKAANDINMVGKGTAKVRVTVLGFNGEIQNANSPKVDTPQNSIGQKIEPAAAPIEEVQIIEDDIVVTTVNSSQSVTTSNTKALTSNIALQVGAFSKIEGANKTKQEYQRRFPSKMVEYVNKNGLYRVLIKGFASENEAQNFKSNNGLNAIIIK